jgi:hypothetical protein
MDDAYNEFTALVEKALSVLRDTSGRIKDSLTTNRRLEREFEHQVLLALKGVSVGSAFTFKEIHSEHGFPDIIAEHQTVFTEDNIKLCYGIEVKTAKTWQTNGNSINNSISDSRIQKIVVVFCKTTDPIEFAYKAYEDAIVGIQVTHFPRYMLSMNAPLEKSVLRKMGLSYDTFKNLPIKEKVALLKAFYETEGKADDKWWIY